MLATSEHLKRAGGRRIVELDNDAHLAPGMLHALESVFDAMEAQNRSVAAMPKNVLNYSSTRCVRIPDDIPDSFCLRNGGVLFWRGVGSAQIARSWLTEFKNLLPKLTHLASTRLQSKSGAVPIAHSRSALAPQSSVEAPCRDIRPSKSVQLLLRRYRMQY